MFCQGVESEGGIVVGCGLVYMYRYIVYVYSRSCSVKVWRVRVALL